MLFLFLCPLFPTPISLKRKRETGDGGEKSRNVCFLSELVPSSSKSSREGVCECWGGRSKGNLRAYEVELVVIEALHWGVRWAAWRNI
jgi:hypothetical protein